MLVDVSTELLFNMSRTRGVSVVGVGVGVNRETESGWSKGQSNASAWTDWERAGINACLLSD